MLTQNKDADRLILMQLDDRSLLEACKATRYSNNLCDERFFIARTKSKFSNLVKPDNISWKDFYLQCIYYIDKLIFHYDIDYVDFSESIETPSQLYKRLEDEDIKNVTHRGVEIAYIHNPSEKVQLAAISQNLSNIKYIVKPSEKVQLALISRDAFRIALIKKPSEKVKLAAVSKMGDAIHSIKNPSEEVKLAAVSQYGPSIRFIKNPSEEVQLAAVSQNPASIALIKNPSEAVKLKVISKNKNAFEYIKNPSKK